jgi:hypothetical protein
MPVSIPGGTSDLYIEIQLLRRQRREWQSPVVRCLNFLVQFVQHAALRLQLSMDLPAQAS